MFTTWLSENRVEAYALDARLFPSVSDRAFWTAAIPLTYAEKATLYLGYEWPTIRATQYMQFHETGNRLAQETPLLNRREALLSLFLGELAEDKGRFLPDIVDGIFAICEETFWGFSAHVVNNLTLPPADNPYIDLFVGETAELLAVIYHVLYDRLAAFCPLILTRMEYELDTRVVRPYLAHRDWWWQGYYAPVNNWNPWILSNILTVLVTLPVAKTERDQAVERTMYEIQRYYESVPNDGSCDEGTVYWTKAGAKLFAYCEVLYRASGGAIDFFENEKLKRIGQYVVHAHITENRFVNFADSSGLMDNAEVQYALYGFGMRTGAEEMCRLAGTLLRCQEANGGSSNIRGTSVKTLVWSLIYANEIAAQPALEHSAFAILPDLQNAFLRSGPWYLAAKGGHNGENHNHNDIGSFLVFANKEPVLVDPGVGIYTRNTFSNQRYTIPTMQSAYHNVPLINGVMQQNGEEFKATAFAATPGMVDIQFAAAYPPQAGVTDLHRTISVNQKGITIVDRFVFDGDGNVFEQFMTPLDVQIDGDSVILDRRYRLRVEGSVPSVDRLAFAEDAKLKTLWKQPYLNRVRFAVNQAAVHITLEGEMG